ncbi:UNVERIFIED_CONTAM: hypothetical protein GTU68_045329 [Idotea baltica]|nr:hypothetical protein [Idotea baltica]
MSKRAKLNTIRIIGGHWRGRRLPVIESQGLRPTIDRVRETLFNWLMHDLAGARCLDLFAGSGALGLESLSRGAGFVKFIESNSGVAGQLQENLSVLVGEKSLLSAQVTCTSALSYLSKMSTEPYDIVFLDPPFDADLLDRSLNLLIGNNYLSEGALIYVEQDVQKQALKVPPSWSLRRQGKAGQSAYYLYSS